MLRVRVPPAMIKNAKKKLKINHVCLAEDRTRDLLINFTLISSLLPLSQAKPGQGIPTEGGRFSTVNLLIKVACFFYKRIMFAFSRTAVID